MALDDEDVERIEKIFGAGLDKFKTEVLPGLVTTGIRAATKDLPTQESITTAIAEAMKPKDDPDPKKKPADDADPAVAALQAQVEQLTRANEASVERAKAAEEATKANRLRSGVRQALLDSGVPSKHVKAALTVIMEEGGFSLGEDGSVVFAKANDFGGTDNVPADEGAKAFLGTDTGRIFLPPTDSGDGGGGEELTGVDAHNVGDPGAIIANALRELSGVA